MGGIARSTLDWYVKEILNVLEKHKKASSAVIVNELKKLPQRRYPIIEKRIIAILKYMQAIGLVTYHKSDNRRIPSKWEVNR